MRSAIAVLVCAALLSGCSPSPQPLDQTAPTVEQAPREATSPTPAPAPTTVYITDTGAKYHREGCRYLAKSSTPISLADAQARGYSACGVCKPPRE